MSCKEICPVCVISVGDNEKGIQCDKNCKRWFHLDCVRLSTSEYTKLSKDTKLTWECSRDDCLNNSKQPLNVLISQISTLSGIISDLSAKVDSLTSIPEKIDLIISEVDDIKKSLGSVERRVSDNETSIKKIQAEVKSIASRSSTSIDPEILIGEVNERTRRAYNIMIYNLVESTDNAADNRKQHDLALVTKLFKSIDQDFNLNGIKSFRVGTKKPGKYRALKVILNSPPDVRLILSKFSSESAAKLDQRFSNIKMSRDRTPRELNYFKCLMQELKEREDQGETDLTVKYLNGVPSIVKKSKN